jgi:hypothetical protein
MGKTKKCFCRIPCIDVVTNGCTGILRLARAFTRTSLRMTEGESRREIADIARDSNDGTIRQSVSVELPASACDHKEIARISIDCQKSPKLKKQLQTAQFGTA